MTERFRYEIPGTLSRRVISFAMIDFAVVLDRDEYQSRKSKRYVWKTERFWDRRPDLEDTMRLQAIPGCAIYAAVAYFRNRINYCEP